jgi:hypothetical protein
MQRERSHTFAAGFPGLEVRISVGYRMPELAHTRGLQATGSHQGEERSYEVHGRCAALTRRSGADSIVHQYDSTV